MADENFSQFKLRIPTSLKDRLESVAGEANRSLSAEIIRRLERSLMRAPDNRLEVEQMRRRQDIGFYSRSRETSEAWLAKAEDMLRVDGPLVDDVSRAVLLQRVAEEKEKIEYYNQMLDKSYDEFETLIGNPPDHDDSR